MVITNYSTIITMDHKIKTRPDEPLQKPEKLNLLVEMLIGVACGACIGGFFDLIYQLATRGGKEFSPGVIGMAFGGPTGIGAILINRLLERFLPSNNPSLRRVAGYSLGGALTGGAILSIFSEGLWMMLFQAASGAIFGLAVGIGIGVIISLLGKKVGL